MFLDQLKKGEWAEVEEVCDDCICGKLYEMGVIPGEKVCVRLTAPNSGPMAISVGGNLVSLRLAEAKGIKIKRCAE